MECLGTVENICSSPAPVLLHLQRLSRQSEQDTLVLLHHGITARLRNRSVQVPDACLTQGYGSHGDQTTPFSADNLSEKHNQANVIGSLSGSFCPHVMWLRRYQAKCLWQMLSCYNAFSSAVWVVKSCSAGPRTDLVPACLYPCWGSEVRGVKLPNHACPLGGGNA